MVRGFAGITIRRCQGSGNRVSASWGRAADEICTPEPSRSAAARKALAVAGKTKKSPPMLNSPDESQRRSGAGDVDSMHRLATQWPMFQWSPVAQALLCWPHSWSAPLIPKVQSLPDSSTTILSWPRNTLTLPVSRFGDAQLPSISMENLPTFSTMWNRQLKL